MDSFGVGERMITSSSEPVFGGVYKLAGIEDEHGNIVPKIKLVKILQNYNTLFPKIYGVYMTKPVARQLQTLLPCLMK